MCERASKIPQQNNYTEQKTKAALNADGFPEYLFLFFRTWIHRWIDIEVIKFVVQVIMLDNELNTSAVVKWSDYVENCVKMIVVGFEHKQ